MQIGKCYVAMYEWQDETIILGTFSNKADAEEWCLEDFYNTFYDNFCRRLQFCDYTAKESVEMDSRYKWENGYKVVETICFKPRRFFDIETREIITEDVVEESLNELKACDPDTYGDITLGQYINNCLTINNGTLEEM